jgi:hypothetical protein
MNGHPKINTIREYRMEWSSVTYPEIWRCASPSGDVFASLNYGICDTADGMIDFVIEPMRVIVSNRLDMSVDCMMQGYGTSNAIG